MARRAAKPRRCKRSLYAESVIYRPKTATLERFCIGPPSLIESSPKTGTASRHTAGNACGAPVAQVQGGDSGARWNGVHGRKADRTSGAACFSCQSAARPPNPMCGRFFIRAGGRPSASPTFCQSFTNDFNYFRISRPVNPVLACYTGIRRNQCAIPSLPSSPSPGGAFPAPSPAAVSDLNSSAYTQVPESSSLRGHPGDASLQKSPQDASPDFGPPPQPIEKESLATP